MKGALIPGGETLCTERMCDAFRLPHVLPKNTTSGICVEFIRRRAAYPSTSRGMLIPSAREAEPVEGRSAIRLCVDAIGMYGAQKKAREQADS